MDSGDSLLIKEAENEIYHTDLDLPALEEFIHEMSNDNVTMVHSRVKIPSPLGMNLYISAFQDLLSMRTKAFLVKDIDPVILRRLLGKRSLHTDLNPERIDRYYTDKVPDPTSPEGLLRLMDVGGGLVEDSDHPLYVEKLRSVSSSTLRNWIEELAEAGRIMRIRGTGSDQIDGKWFSKSMAGVHGTLGCLATAGASDMDNVRELYTGNLFFQSTSSVVDSDWQDVGLSDPHECLRVKILDLLGSEGPKPTEELVEDCHSLRDRLRLFSMNLRFVIYFQ